MLKLEELKERLRTINFDSRRSILKQNFAIINKAVEAIERPMPIILSDPFDLFNDISKTRLAKFELSDIKDIAQNDMIYKLKKDLKLVPK